MNGSTTTVNGAAVNGTNGALNGIGAAPRTATLGTPSSYAYTSSGSLLGRGGAARPVPPPTLPKYSGSFSAGSTTALRERDREGAGGSHRLASLERLALRQRIIEQSANNQVSTGLIINTPANGGPTSATVTLTDTATQTKLTRCSSNVADTVADKSKVGWTSPRDIWRNLSMRRKAELQSKRELFFKSDTVSGGSATGPPISAPPAPPTALKDALAKRSATLPDALENNHHEPNGPAQNAKLTNSASVDNAPKLTSSGPPSNSAPPVPTGPPGSVLRSTENIIKKPDHPPVAPKPDIPKIEKPKTKELDGYVGFANLPNQVYRKAVKKGETGLGKSTLINSLFLTEVYDKDKHPGPSLRVKKTVGVETSVVLLKENGVNLTLTIVDTPGFGDASRVTRKAAPPDTRVHCCVYFIAPSGHGLKPLDVEFMQRLSDKVNIIPSTGEEGEGADATKALRTRVPFAVVGANTVIEQDGKRIRGRKYPWGIAEAELARRHEGTRRALEAQARELEDRQRALQAEKSAWERETGLSLDDLRRRSLEANSRENMARELEDRQRALQAEKSAWERETGLSLDDLRHRSLEANSRETVDGKEKKDKKKKGLF
ncbi:putative septin [Operophtera brumata]|uniref:Putative septin n=1 Tax=Operophtera brumata TaxID=104452 RepID=A0A0L7LW64_OPEBR|nr:putative septin [Operophtera brumata]